jgi:hypothetical protein
MKGLLRDDSILQQPLITKFAEKGTGTQGTPVLWRVFCLSGMQRKAPVHEVCLRRGAFSVTKHLEKLTPEGGYPAE